MRLLSRLFSKDSAPALAPSPPPLPDIVERRGIRWPDMFDPVVLPVGAQSVLALHLRTQEEIECLGLSNPELVTRRCWLDGMKLIVLTTAENLRVMPPLNDDDRHELLARLTNRSSFDVDHWNSALLVMHRDIHPHGQSELTRTALTGLHTRSTSRLMEGAELSLHLAIKRGDIPLR